MNRARLPAGSRKKTPERAEARLFRAESSHRATREGIDVHFLIAEVHPFDDGNGRISKLHFTVELLRGDQATSSYRPSFGKITSRACIR